MPGVRLENRNQILQDLSSLLQKTTVPLEGGLHQKGYSARKIHVNHKKNTSPPPE